MKLHSSWLVATRWKANTESKMRLINVKTLKLEAFLDHEAPPYAIVSHTWGDPDEELTISDIDGTVEKPGIGLTKLRGCCQQAMKDGLDYVWMDTCCIDKRDSASICYAYLSDVPTEDPKAPDSKFRGSRWFSRGWTLQELLAPKDLNFYSSNWEHIGSKVSLCVVIESITGIPRLVLKGVDGLQTISVAQRMSWAAKRETKRKEDRAYSLQGIFGIQGMATIYGEGEQKAFFRLQEEIIKSTADHSILAWGLRGKQLPPTDGAPITAGRVLAATPADFAHSGHIVSRVKTRTSLDFVNISRGGVQIHMPLLPGALVPGSATQLKFGLLSCGPANDPSTVIAILLVEAGPDSPGEFVRPADSRPVLHPTVQSSAELIHIKNDIHLEGPPDWGLQYDDDEFADLDLDVLEVEPESCWDKERNMIMAGTQPQASRFVILVRLRHRDDTPWDFFMALALNAGGRKVEATPHMADVLGKRCASSGSLNLEMTLEPIPARPSMFNIKPTKMKEKPKNTVDITDRLKFIKLAAEMTKANSELVKAESELKGLEQQMDTAVSRFSEIDSGIAEVASEIRRLEERLEMLSTEKVRAMENIPRLQERKAEVLQASSNALEDRTSAQQHWDALSDREYDKSRWGENTTKGWAPLVWACERGDPGVVELLVWNGANPSLRDDAGNTPLASATANGNIEVVRELLTHGADVNAWTSRDGGTTALHVAVRERPSLPMVQLLLSAGADARIKNHRGSRPYESNRHADKEIIDLVRHAAIRGPTQSVFIPTKPPTSLSEPNGTDNTSPMTTTSSRDMHFSRTGSETTIATQESGGSVETIPSSPPIDISNAGTLFYPDANHGRRREEGHKSSKSRLSFLRRR
ncbi:hypothetical protein QBC34DRAFT_439720 [Podospora aff. communis PSN243]|uniref:DUF8212 domain-containing protein n=1 Tax=Podospora aff. communis PSN243 TaxID=3040156 RepID=A0AAV9GK08_9PEZI|nr:hypothetical protein QBC34DRAFT_439720 [Podospora aff. communis PSN243]